MDLMHVVYLEQEVPIGKNLQPKAEEMGRGVSHLHREFKRKTIDPSRVHYIGNGVKDSKTYVSEVENLSRCLRLYFDYWTNVRDFLSDCVIFSDNGNGFFEGGTKSGADVLLEIGFGRHEFFPEEVHEVLSPNDNRLHGRKKNWKAEFQGDFSDDVAACLWLMDIFDEVPKEDTIGLVEQKLAIGCCRCHS